MDATTEKFRARYLELVTLYLDYGSKDGKPVPGSLVPVPAELLSDMMDGMADGFSRLAAIDILARTFNGLVKTETQEHNALEQIVSVLDLPQVTPEVLSGLLDWGAKYTAH